LHFGVENIENNQLEKESNLTVKMHNTGIKTKNLNVVLLLLCFTTTVSVSAVPKSNRILAPAHISWFAMKFNY